MKEKKHVEKIIPRVNWYLTLQIAVEISIDNSEVNHEVY